MTSLPRTPPLAALLARLAAPDTAALVQDCVQRLLQQRDLGDVCLPLAALAGHERGDGQPFPPVDALRRDLHRSGIVGDGAAPSALVLDARDRLYLHVHHRAEQRIAAAVRRRLQAGERHPPAAIRAALQATGLLPAAATTDWQLAAVVAACRNRFALLTGGPGTGKTTTVARVLAAHLHLQPGLRPALCAPTGKAAARLDETLQAHRQRLRLPELPPATTVHRLLGYRPVEDAFRHDADRPLPVDLLVLDEASMVDPLLFAALLAALPEQAALLVLGDRDQLAAVGSGQVLGDLCAAARPEAGAGPALQACARAAADLSLPLQPQPTLLADATVLLRDNHRFAQAPGLSAFAAALAARQPAAAAAALAAGHTDLQPVPGPEAALAVVQDVVLAVPAAASAAAALAGLQQLRILCASHHGPHGVHAWNRRIAQLLHRHGHAVRTPFHRGQPLLITSNDHQTRLWNGDLGVVWPDADGRLQFHLPRGDGSLRAVPVALLPPHETAWAMTVHKAQGSEFDTVLLSMPEADSPLWSAPVLYTGITRARRRALLLAPPDRLAAALAQWPTRSSGLADALSSAP